jgi:hypothetical protein
MKTQREPRAMGESETTAINCLPTVRHGVPVASQKNQFRLTIESDYYTTQGARGFSFYFCFL